MPVIVSSGNFWVCAADANDDTRETGQEILLDPNPTTVDYGERLNHTMQESAGRTVKQWTNTNPGLKRWIWKNYGPHVPRYSSQYKTLYNMQEHINVIVSSGSPYVYLKEDTTDGLSALVSGEFVPVWVKCRILMVKRTIRDGGGLPVYETSEMIFTIDDPNFVTY